MALYEILFRFKPDGTLRGSHAIDWNPDGRTVGLARRLTEAESEALGGLLDSAQQARIAELTDELAATKAAHAAELESLRAQPRPEPAADPVVAELGDLFNSLAPQVQVAFAPAFAIVRTLIQAGRRDLAAAHIAGLPVPESLAPIRDQMVAALTPE